jgi:NADH-quinone oxidoreductase subunit M
MDHLGWLTFLPLLGALALLCVPARSTRMLRALAMIVTGAVSIMGIALWLSFDGASGAAQGVVEVPWFNVPGAGGSPIEVRFHLGVDGLSILMVALTAILMPIVVLSSVGHVSERVKEFLIWLLVMETGMLGVFLALDLVLFYFFWEVSLVPLYFIVGIWGGERRLYATVKFFLFTLAGSLVMLIGVLALVYQTGSTDVGALFDAATSLPLATQTWIFLAFALAFAIKVPILPFHTWLADAHTEAPTAGSVLLAGVLLKMGTYGLLRFGIQMFPEVAVAWSPLFMALGAIGIVYGALVAMAQTDLKRLIACSSVSHLGFVVLGLFALTEAGLRGGVLQMLNHGISTGLLFLLVGMIYERRHTRALDQFGGLASVMPLFALFFVITVLSSVGLPGLNGFVGEYLVLLGTFESSPLWAAVAVSGVVLGAVYLLMATRRLLFGPVTRAENHELSDLGPREVGLMLPLVALAFWIGIQPNAFLDRTAGALTVLCDRIEKARVAERIGRAATSADEPPLALHAAERAQDDR